VGALVLRVTPKVQEASDYGEETEEKFLAWKFPAQGLQISGEGDECYREVAPWELKRKCRPIILGMASGEKGFRWKNELPLALLKNIRKRILFDTGQD